MNTPTIDSHAHLLAVTKGGFVSPKLKKGLIFRALRRILGLGGVPDESIDEAYVEKLLSSLDSPHAPDGLVLLAMDGRYDSQGHFDESATSFYVENDRVFEVCERDPRLLPAASINPKRRDALDELERVVERGAVCLKTVPNSQGFDPADPALRPFWRRMGELKLPWLTHTGREHTIPIEAQTWGDPRRLIPALEEGATVIAAHVGSAGPLAPNETFGEFVELLPSYSNLYGDLSALTSLGRGKYLKRVERLIPEIGERLLYGSDYPIPSSLAFFLPRLGLKRTRHIQRSGDLLTRPLLITKAHKIPDEVFARAWSLLRITEAQRDALRPNAKPLSAYDV